MNWLSSDLVILLVFLLPGFVAAACFYWLTSLPKPSPFERVVQALVFTAIVQSSAWIIRLEIDRRNEVSLDESATNALTVFLAVGIGLVFAVAVNHDVVHRIFRLFKMTRENSYKSVWRSTLSSRQEYVVLHLVDGRRLYGWPAEWPNRSDDGHFRITEAEWLDANRKGKRKEASAILISATDVRMVEFVETTGTLGS